MQLQLREGRVTWKQGWEIVGDKRCYFKSRWEFRYAQYLEFMKKHNKIVDWQYEPKTFYFEGIKRGTTNYKPDFLVTFPSGNSEWFEVKGFMDSKSKTKIKRMAKYHPSEKLNIVDKFWFTTNSPLLKKVIKNW